MSAQRRDPLRSEHRDAAWACASANIGKTLVGCLTRLRFPEEDRFARCQSPHMGGESLDSVGKPRTASWSPSRCRVKDVLGRDRRRQRVWVEDTMSDPEDYRNLYTTSIPDCIVPTSATSMYAVPSIRSVLCLEVVVRRSAAFLSTDTSTLGGCEMAPSGHVRTP